MLGVEAREKRAFRTQVVVLQVERRQAMVVPVEVVALPVAPRSTAAWPPSRAGGRGVGRVGLERVENRLPSIEHVAADLPRTQKSSPRSSAYFLASVSSSHWTSSAVSLDPSAISSGVLRVVS